MGYDEENRPISKEVTLYGDPLAAYKNKTGAYIDSDEDNIPDVVESLLSNNSTFLKFAKMFADPNSAYYNKSLWENYSWCIAYLYSIALKNSSLSDADIKFYSILDNITADPINSIQHYEEILKGKENDNYTENATQWLRDEFNPIIVESMSPVITQFIAVTDVGCFYAYTKVTVELRDPSGIGRIILKSQPEKDVPLIYDIRVLIPPYHITRISTKYVNILQVHISKNGTSFAILEVRLLNPDYMRIIAPLKTPLSFFNPSNRRIVGDGDKVLHIELPKAIWDIHTEFEDNTNLLIVEVNGENLRGHKNILNIIEFIRDSLEKQNYSNEIVKKLPNAMVASNGYMKGYLCLDCGYLIPRKRLKDKCPATGNKHNTTPILLDIRAHRYQSERLSIVTVFLILGILTLFIYINKIFPWYSFGYFLVIGIVLSLTIALIYGWYCRNIAAFKNMLKHFEAKKRFIMEQIKEKEES